MTTYPNRRRRGFSLVELLIAFFVLLVGILAVLVLFPIGLKHSRQMVSDSTASFVGRNARALMETHPFKYHNGSDEKRGYGTASIVQVKFGPRGRHGAITTGSFPVMFPGDVLGIDESEFPAFKLELRTHDADDATSTTPDRIIYETSPQYSWDARITVGKGIGEVPPPGGFNNNDVAYWWVQYYKYYAVQISVYRNYKWNDTVWQLPAGVMWLRARKKADGSDYDLDDINRPLKSEIEFAGPTVPHPEMAVGCHIRVRGDKSDWYQITDFSYKDGKFVYTLDRPYAGLDATGQASTSKPVSDVIGTTALVQSFTTMLGSQLDDTDTSNLTIP